MIPSRENIGREPSLIEDVVMPPTEQFTDPDRGVARRRSIGNLHQQYLRRLKKKPNIPLGSKSLSGIKGGSTAILSPPHYTIVPPLSKLHSTPDNLPAFSSASLLSLLLLLSAPIEIARGLGAKLSKATDRLPKKYSASSGVTTDWEATAWDARYALPLVLVLFILSVLLFGLLNGPHNKPGQSVNKPLNITSIPVKQTAKTGGKGAANGPVKNSSQSGAVPLSQGSSSSTGGSSFGYSSISSGTTSGTSGSGSTSGSGGTTGGMGGGGGSTGGGGSILPTCSIGQIATTTCLVTQCTPQVVLAPGQKAILGVDGTCVVIN